MKALGLVISDKKIFENCILKTYFLTLWPTYATNWNNLNNFGRGPPRDHSCEVWSKSNERFQRRRSLSKKVYTRHTADDGGQRPITIAHPEHFVLRWAKNVHNFVHLQVNGNHVIFHERIRNWHRYTKRKIPEKDRLMFALLLRLSEWLPDLGMAELGPFTQQSST